MKNSAHGFTLIELLVVVAIIAVLSVIAFAVFNGVTGRGNDSRRSTDIKAFADAMEVKKSASSSFYVTVAATDFATGTFPTEPSTRTEKYCYKDGTAAILNPVPGDWVPATPVACPTGWANVSGSAPTVAATATFFKFCTINEAKNAVICQGSRQ